MKTKPQKRKFVQEMTFWSASQLYVKLFCTPVSASLQMIMAVSLAQSLIRSFKSA